MALTSTGSYYSKPNKAVHAGNVSCQGGVENLQQCSIMEYARKEIMASDIVVAGVSCIYVPSASSTISSAGTTVLMLVQLQVKLLFQIAQIQEPLHQR